MIIKYNPKLKELARQLRNNATKAEIFLWQKLKRNQMYGYDFHRQKPIDQYIVDFFCNKLRLAIELDGYSHQITEVWEKDVKKTKCLNELGINILRFSDYQVMNEMENVLRAIEDYIVTFEEKGFTPPSIPPC
ncbi:endonuclease domain-containing protein [Flagellimonas sp. HMM57]|uniref:endonuclease domain-containing protein n=1 Tax=unclassified Flagellimonas TaxID=2644544 RepID=UPI0013D1E482|nr:MULTISPECIES: endonuclease domain-containing protein [unclassified Flagellimonas]MBS9463839.1 endonuclease domain-containing protein [Flagellimonas sp. 389]UII75519.1 endonuclease domain-containing protein [Flagellimonas sp. HMM57]